MAQSVFRVIHKGPPQRGLSSAQSIWYLHSPSITQLGFGLCDTKTAANYDEAETWLLAAIGAARSKFGAGSSQTYGALEDLLALYESSGQTVLASRYRQ